MLSVTSAYTKISPPYMSEPPLTKKGDEPFKKSLNLGDSVSLQFVVSFSI